MQIDLIYPFDQYEVILEDFLQSSWQGFLRGLQNERNQVKDITPNIDVLSYETSIKKAKIKIKQKTMTYIESDLFNELLNHIQFVYDLWHRKEDEVEK